MIILDEVLCFHCARPDKHKGHEPCWFKRETISVIMHVKSFPWFFSQHGHFFHVRMWRWEVWGQISSSMSLTHTNDDLHQKNFFNDKFLQGSRAPESEVTNELWSGPLEEWQLPPLRMNPTERQLQRQCPLESSLKRHGRLGLTLAHG